MRFDGELESAYRRDQFQDRLRYLRINLAILAAISLTIIQIDRVVVPVIGRIVPDLARTGVMLPLLLLGFAITFIRRADAWYPRYIAVAMIVALAGMSWISLTAWGEGEPRVFVRLLLAIVAVYFVLGLAFRSAIAVNAIGLAAYAALAASKGMPGVEMTHYLTTLVTANIICIAGAYNLEHARRIAWLEGQRLAESALKDGLTGIHNRRRFDEHLQRVWAQSVRERKPIALLFADLDHFKPYNDRYGHQAGDGAMKAVAEALSRFARRPMDLAARYGGEEFGDHPVRHETRAGRAHRRRDPGSGAPARHRAPGFERGPGAHDQHRHRLRRARRAAQLGGAHPAGRPGALCREGRRPQSRRGPRAGIRAHADRLLPPPSGGERRGGKARVSRSRPRAGRSSRALPGTCPRC